MGFSIAIEKIRFVFHFYDVYCTDVSIEEGENIDPYVGREADAAKPRSRFFLFSGRCRLVSTRVPNLLKEVLLRA